jgi:hypothetical protein
MRFREVRSQLKGPPKAGGGIRKITVIVPCDAQIKVHFGVCVREFAGTLNADAAESAATSLIFFPAAAGARIISAGLHHLRSQLSACGQGGHCCPPNRFI